MSMTKLILGILDCDDLSPELRGDYHCYTCMFKTLFLPYFQSGAPFESCSIDYRRYDVQNGKLPADTRECDAYLITGSKTGVYDDKPWIAALKLFIQQAYEQEIKLVGLCFGHQILADALGGKAEKSSKGWGIGAMTSQLVEQTDWMPEKLETLCLLYSHQDQVTCLPPKAKVIYSSDFCEFSAFYIPKCVLAFQGHPEFTVDYSHRLMFIRQARYAEGQYKLAIESLEQPLHSDILGRWIINFLPDEIHL
jgi:GMP synthase-like glutamine amidotransferase